MTKFIEMRAKSDGDMPPANSRITSGPIRACQKPYERTLQQLLVLLLVFFKLNELISRIYKAFKPKCDSCWCTSFRLAPKKSKASLNVIRKYVWHLTSQDALLVVAPKPGVQQISVMLHKSLSHTRIAQ